ncbi:hypothetical protein D9619_002103 [Psilocybe cf. subviscida]|uniref:BTB domain-containing protein n=1 Tax=Psilocybe cf. subviscida TaxID=2480587 RepID=A0A8H5BFS0_9AGAR|nr:hypothetical protein D9619_002103 [Psilocybe cf. subviscida]
MYGDTSSPQVDGTDLEEPPASRADSPSPVKPHSFWNVEPIYIQVDKTLFVVPRDAFQGANSGSLFEVARRASPSATVDDVEGLSRARPILLENVTEHEFDLFLHAIYPAGQPQKPKLDGFEDWSKVLRLSTMWDYEVARKQAIDSLTKIIKTSNDAAAILRLGKEHCVAEWTRDAYIALIRDTSIGMKELTTKPFDFDWETIAKITQAKYEAVPKFPYSKKPSRYCSYCGQSHFSPSGTLQICLCRATAMFEEYFTGLNDVKSTQTPSPSLSAFASVGDA